MKAFLMHRERDFDPDQILPVNEKALTQDLELNSLFNAMALGDEFLFEMAKLAVLSSNTDLDTIHYRQNILRDCLKNPSVVREIYQIPIDSIIYKKKHWLGVFSRYPGGILYGALEIMQMFVDLLIRLKKLPMIMQMNLSQKAFAGSLR